IPLHGRGLPLDSAFGYLCTDARSTGVLRNRDGPDPAQYHLVGHSPRRPRMARPHNRPADIVAVLRPVRFPHRRATRGGCPGPACRLRAGGGPAGAARPDLLVSDRATGNRRIIKICIGYYFNILGKRTFL